MCDDSLQTSYYYDKLMSTKFGYIIDVVVTVSVVRRFQLDDVLGKNEFKDFEVQH